MIFQLPELPVNFSGVTCCVAGIATAIIVIARLSRGPNVSGLDNITSTIEFSIASLARCNPDGWIHQLVWLLVGRFQQLE